MHWLCWIICTWCGGCQQAVSTGSGAEAKAELVQVLT